MMVRSSANPLTLCGLSLKGISEKRWLLPFVSATCWITLKLRRFDHFCEVPFAVLEVDGPIIFNGNDFCKVPPYRLIIGSSQRA